MMFGSKKRSLLFSVVLAMWFSFLTGALFYYCLLNPSASGFINCFLGVAISALYGAMAISNTEVKEKE